MAIGMATVCVHLGAANMLRRGCGDAMGVVRIGIVPPLELVTCSHVFSPQLPLNQTCKLSSPNRLCALDASAPPKRCRGLASVDPYDSGITSFSGNDAANQD